MFLLFITDEQYKGKLMKKILAINTLFLILSTPVLHAEEYKTLDKQYSYALGYNVGKNIAKQFQDVDKAAMLQALQDAINNSKPKMTLEQMKQAFQQVAEKKKQEKTAQADKNTAAGKKYINQYSKKEGVKPLSDGIFYRVMKSGKGTSPRADSKVSVHYKGTLINGKVFDSSYDRGQPAEFPLNRVIKGWQIAVQKMQPGDKWEIVIPSELAYGEQGAPGGTIGPNETLIFEVELLKVL